MINFLRKSRKQNRSAKKENRLRLEALESRLLLSISNPLLDIASSSAIIGPIADLNIDKHDAVVMPDSMILQGDNPPIMDGIRGINPLDTITYSTLPNGMPILNSYPDNPSHATIFVDLDGDPYVLNGSACQPYSEDADPTTFNAAEQATIVEGWRQMAVYFAMFDVNVTTIQPNVSTTPTAWTVITPNEGNGWSWVGNFPNSSSNSFENSYFIQSRVTGIAHEVGHTFGNWHTSDYNNLGVKTAEYSSGLYTASPSPLQGPLMGVDFAQIIHKWTIWHDSGAADTLQDDMAIIANSIKNGAANKGISYSGDGYRPDDYGGTIATATPLTVTGVTQSKVGIIERLTDADAFSFTSTGGNYSITAGRDAPSGVDLKLSIYNSSGTLLASEDGDPRSLPYTMVNDQELAINLPAGTYYAIVESHSNYGDQGQYVLRVDPLPDAWKSNDIGLTGVPGCSSYDAATSTFTVTGSGDDIWNTRDSFQYLYQTLSGDGSITARVASITNTDGNAKSGIMIRESLDGGSRFVDLVMTPSNGIYAQDRTSTNGGCNTVATPSKVVAAPYWLQITRTGNSFVFKVSTSGTSWVQIGTVSITMGTNVYIGLVSSSHNNGLVNAATFTDVSLTGTLNPPPTLNALPAPGSLTITGKTASSISLSWSDVSGETGFSIERSADNVDFKQVGTTAAGVTTYTDSGLSDALKYFYRVRAVDGSGVSAPSSIVSDITRAGAVSNLRIISYTSSELVLDWTDASGETGYRIERSANGTSGWTTVGTVGKNIPTINDTSVTVGAQYYYRVVTLDTGGDAAISSVAMNYSRLAVVSGLAFDSISFGIMTFHWTAVTNATSYRIERSIDAGATYTTLASSVAGTSYTDYGLTALQEYYYRVTAVNSLTEGSGPSTAIHAIAPPSNINPPWVTQDVGSATGAAGYSEDGTFTLISTGAGIAGSSDSFRFVYQPLTGDGWIIAQVASLQNSATTAKAGVMIRQNMNTNSRYAATLLQANGTASFQSRSGTSTTTTTTYGSTINAPYWVRITRTGTIFTSDISSDGATWVTIGSRSITGIAAGSTVYVGLALASGSTSVQNTSTFNNVSVNNSAPTVTASASASPNPVTGTTTNLSALGADDHGETNLTYTWTATTLPAGAAQPTYSVNGTNAAKAATATFSKAGNYVFQVTITDTSGLTVTSSTAMVAVSSIATTVTVTPPSVVLLSGGSQQFSATVADQFGNAYSAPISWTATSGSINSSGYYISGATSPVTITATSGSISGTASVVVDTHVPTVATPAAASPNPVTSTSTAMSVLGADVEGESNLTYTWTATAYPVGASPTYSVNGTNAAKNTTATFSKIGSYTFLVTIADAVGHAITSSVDVTVNQVISNIVVTPSILGLQPGTTYQFSAAAKDQFGTAILPAPSLTWTATVGTIDANGFFTAPLTNTTGTVSATSGSTTGTASVTTINTAPTVATRVAASPATVTGTTTNLSVLGADDWGEANLTYTWSAPTVPSGAPQPTYSINGTNAAKNTTVTFYKAGLYNLRATITDSLGLTITSSLYLTVSQTFTSIVVTPGSVDVPQGGTQQFTAAAFDQFGIAMTKTFTWSATAGSITTGGLFTAPASPFTATVRATSGAITGTASVNMSNNPPTDILLSNQTVAENAPGAAIGTLSTVDPNAGDTFTYSLQSDPTAKFEIVGNALKLKDGQSLDFETTPTVELVIRTTDNGGLSFDKTLAIAVTDVPETPTDILLSNQTVAENAPGATIGTLSTVDPDTGDTFTYSLQSDPTAKFEIVGNVLKLVDGQSLNFETTPSVALSIRTTDSGGLSFDKAFTITVTDVQDPPTDILLSNTSIAENQAGATIGTLSTVDPDTGDTFTYSLLSDPTAKFEIVGNVLKLVDGQSLDFETTPSVALSIRTTDNGGLSYDKAFTITVTDQAETLVVGTGDWAATGLTLQLDVDGKLHVYQTGSTTDAVPPHNPANVLGIEITGNGIGNVLTVESLATGIPGLAVNQAKTVLGQDNALTAGTNVTISGGELDYNGHNTAIGNLTLTGGAQALITNINNNATTTVESGTLTATSIIGDSLFIGTHAVASSQQQARQLALQSLASDLETGSLDLPDILSVSKSRESLSNTQKALDQLFAGVK
jgi:regulation of enolase protein 1 (concanavalin A-like superfamily)